MINLNLREATNEDSKMLFEWANDQDVRFNAFSNKIIEWDDHIIWLNKKLKSKTCKIFILTNNDLNFGQIRIDLEENFWIIDYSIDKKYRGLGFGKIIVELLIKNYNTANYRAVVKAINKPSIKVFESLNFSKIINPNNQLICFEKINDK